MKILHLLSQRPDSTGSGIYIQALLRQARLAGHENFLMAGIQADQRPTLPDLPPDRVSFIEFGGQDVSFPIVGMSDVMPYDSRRFNDLSELEIQEYEGAFEAKLRQAVAEFQPDLIHSSHLWLLSSLARRLFPELPMIAGCYGSDLRQFENCPQLRNRVLDGCEKLDGVLALSEAMKNDVQRLYGLDEGRIHIVGAGYDETLFARAERAAPDPVRLVYAGKLSNAKGVPWLLRALDRIDSLDWELDLVGSGGGPEGKRCLELAAQLGPRVRVHGAVKQTELAGIMRQSHLFILPSFFEGLPLVIVEALACGCRVVATDLPGVRELLIGVDSPGIELVNLPRLQNADIPYVEDEGKFEEDLTGAIETQIGAALLQPDWHEMGLERITSACTWPAVFDRINNIYSNYQNLPEADR